MNTKRFITLSFIAIMGIAVTARASWAGSARTHRLEGAVIGIGALILTKAIIDHHHNAYGAEARPVVQQYNRPRHHGPAGHWEIRKEWVPGQYKKVWNPGHYNRRGNWVPGSWKRIETEPGYWAAKRVWAPYH